MITPTFISRLFCGSVSSRGPGLFAPPAFILPVFRFPVFHSPAAVFSAPVFRPVQTSAPIAPLPVFSALRPGLPLPVPGRFAPVIATTPEKPNRRDMRMSWRSVSVRRFRRRASGAPGRPHRSPAVGFAAPVRQPVPTAAACVSTDPYELRLSSLFPINVVVVNSMLQR